MSGDVAHSGAGSMVSIPARRRESGQHLPVWRWATCPTLEVLALAWWNAVFMSALGTEFISAEMETH